MTQPSWNRFSVMSVTRRNPAGKEVSVMVKDRTSSDPGEIA